METFLRFFSSFLISIDKVFFVLIAGFAFLLFTRFWRFARKGLLFCVFGIVILFVCGPNLLTFLENRHTIPDLPDNVSGIIVLGGAFEHGISQARGITAFNISIKRLTTAIELSHRFPDAKVIFSGGEVGKGLPGEHQMAEQFLSEQGFPEERLIWERKAKNTLENALLLRDIIQPQPSQNWILVTSAFHMPRSVGLFEGVGWKNMIPYPADYLTKGHYGLIPMGNDALKALKAGRVAFKEFIALAYNWATGKSSEFLPKQS